MNLLDLVDLLNFLDLLKLLDLLCLLDLDPPGSLGVSEPPGPPESSGPLERHRYLGVPEPPGLPGSPGPCISLEPWILWTS